MYDLISQIISHNWSTSDSSQQYIYSTCCVLIILFSTVFIDLIYRLMRNLFKGG